MNYKIGDRFIDGQGYTFVITNVKNGWVTRKYDGINSNTKEGTWYSPSYVFEQDLQNGYYKGIQCSQDS